MRRPGLANDPAELLASLPAVQQRASTAFPHAEDAIDAFQPNLNFIRAYTPDIFNGLGKLGQVDRLLRRQRPLRPGRSSPASTSSTTTAAAASSNRSRRAEQFDAFGSSAGVQRRCPGGATQPAADGSNPFIEPAVRAAAASTLRMQPGRRAPGP